MEVSTVIRATTTPITSAGPSSEVSGEGEGATVNVLLPPRPGGDEYRACLAEVLKATAEFCPEALIVSLGVDTLAGDPSGDGQLSSADLRIVGADIGALRLPSVLLLEGGYELEGLGDAFTNCVRGFNEGIDRR